MSETQDEKGAGRTLPTDFAPFTINPIETEPIEIADHFHPSTPTVDSSPFSDTIPDHPQVPHIP